MPLHKNSLLAAAVMLVITGFTVQATPILTDPLASITMDGDFIVLKKQLTGHVNYGADMNGGMGNNNSTGADILYTGDHGIWNFDLADYGLNASDFDLATLDVSLMLDDHWGVAPSTYFAALQANGTTLLSGSAPELGIGHGTGYGIYTAFFGWTTVSADLPGVSDRIAIGISNTGSGFWGDWIGVDQMTLRLHRDPTPVPEPASCGLLITGLSMMGLWRAFRRKQSR